MFRIGHGYDMHKLSSNRNLILCGEKIPHEKGLLGHSDADVATHALIDALLGAAALGDIGQHFPDSDEQYKNISSLKLLEKVVSMLTVKRFCIINVDITIVAQLPKIDIYKEKMKINLQKILLIEKELINIKATTEEGCGIVQKIGSMKVTNVCEAVMEVLEMTGFADILVIE